jgi:hypothetical protein
MCVGVGYEARAAPTSLFLLVDDSVHATRFELERWSSLLDAVQRLANAPATGEVWVGLELMSRAAEAAGAAEHAPLVPLVEGNSWPLVHRELSSAEPEGMPATLPALETALAYARSHASEHGERRTSLVLVSSGHTPACSGEATLDLLENAVAEAHHAASPVTTFVIDLGAEPTLESVAAAGGTEHASWFDEFDPSEALLDALLGALTSTAQSTGLCQYELPGPPWVDDIDTDLISVWYYEGRSVGEVPRVAGLAECDTAASGGWYLPRAVGGSAGRVILCPCSCSFAQGRTIELGLGCRASVP